MIIRLEHIKENEMNETKAMEFLVEVSPMSCGDHEYYHWLQRLDDGVVFSCHFILP